MTELLGKTDTKFKEYTPWVVPSMLPGILLQNHSTEVRYGRHLGPHDAELVSASVASPVYHSNIT